MPADAPSAATSPAPTSPADLSPLVLVGALHVDELFHPLRELVPRASSPVRRERRIGGVAANVARSALRRTRELVGDPTGATRDVVLVSATGDDADGERLHAALQGEGIDCRVRRLPGHRTGSYTAVHDASGELYVGLADTALIESLSVASVLEALGSIRPAAFVLDANLSPDCLAALLAEPSPSATSPTASPSPADDVRALDGVARIAMAVSPDKALRLSSRLRSLDLLFCNRREAAALAGLPVPTPIDVLADAITTLGVRRLVLSDGSEPLIVRAGERRASIAVPPLAAEPVSVNGAGDALAGATLAHWLADDDLEAAVRESGLPAARGEGP